MLSQTATDALNECDYERVRTQLYQALHGDGNPPYGERLWLAGRHVSMQHSEGNDGNHAPSRHHTTA